MQVLLYAGCVHVNPPKSSITIEACSLDLLPGSPHVADLHGQKPLCLHLLLHNCPDVHAHLLKRSALSSVERLNIICCSKRSMQVCQGMDIRSAANQTCQTQHGRLSHLQATGEAKVIPRCISLSLVEELCSGHNVHCPLKVDKSQVTHHRASAWSG